MPSVSDKQHKLMEAVKHSSKFAKKVGIPQSVGQEFADADEHMGKFKKQARVTKHLRKMK